MTDETLNAEIDTIVASCNGDLRGALTALLLINEQLERELQVRLAAAAPLASRIAASDTRH